MEKKILIGSLVAVAILVLVSFTGVVGYQTTKSSTNAKASPLFTIRSSRAIDEESKDIVCDYVGKGQQSLINIPNRDDKKVLLQKILVKIQDIDDKELKRMSYLNLINDNELIEHPIIQHILSDDVTLEANDYTSSSFYTLCNWFPGCIPYMLLMIPLAALYIMFFLFLWKTWTVEPCLTYYVPC